MSDNPERIFYQEFSKRVGTRITLFMAIGILFLLAGNVGIFSLPKVLEDVDTSQNSSEDLNSNF